MNVCKIRRRRILPLHKNGFGLASHASTLRCLLNQFTKGLTRDLHNAHKYSVKNSVEETDRDRTSNEVYCFNLSLISKDIPSLLTKLQMYVNTVFHIRCILISTTQTKHHNLLDCLGIRYCRDAYKQHKYNNQGRRGSWERMRRGAVLTYCAVDGKTHGSRLVP